MVGPEGGSQVGETEASSEYIIPVGRMIYQRTRMNREWPGEVLNEFTAKKLAFSSHHKLTEFEATSQTTLFYRGQTRYLYVGSHFFSYTKGLKKARG